MPDTNTAQTAQGAQGATAPANAATASPAERQPDEIVVTGSRIARPEFAAPNPIVSFNSAAIQQSGNTNVTNFLQRVPALTGSLDSTQTAGFDSTARTPFGGAGLNELNLRNLGTNRTLVLVNGRRHVAGEVNTAAVDINSIPTDLIERVDVLTGGASAVYGADGVSGVVNFITKRDFAGLSARGQMGVSQYGDAPNRFASILAGRNFADGRGNLTLGYEYNADDALAQDDRKFLRQDRRRYIVTNVLDPNDDPRLPDNVLVGDLRYGGQSFFGAVDVNGDGIADFTGDGRRYNAGTPVGYYVTGGDSTPVAGFVGDLLPRTRRHAANLLGHYDFGDAFKLSVEAKFVQTRATTSDLYTVEYPATLAIDNPFIPANIRAAATGGTINIIRDNLDFGRHGEDDRRRTYRGVIDVSGRISDHATYDVYGRTDTRIVKLNDRLSDRFLAAIDAVTDPLTGRATCRSNLIPAAAAGAATFTPGRASGCVPINLFGSNTADPASLAFFQYNPVSQATITQQVVDGSISGDFGAFFKLPGGPVQFSVGAEYRRETSDFRPDPYLRQALFYQFDEPALVPASRGRFDVKEVFGELNAPILENMPFAQTLSVGAAGRYSDYSTIGSTSTWQFNGVYAPVRDISFRGSYGKAVRAPNIGELFAPLAGSQYFFSDPCDPTTRNNGTQYRAANCATLLTALGINPATFSPLTSAAAASTVLGSQSGNANLRAETARTWTAGVVLRPRFLRGLTVSVDWFDIRLKGAISIPGAQSIAELCVDQPTVTNVYCAAISRSRTTGFINGFTVQPQNVSAFRTAGADLNLDYLLRTASYGTFDFRFVGGYLNRLDLVATPGAVVEDDVDQAGRPKFNFNFSPSWTLGGLTLTYNLRWFDRTRRFAKLTTQNQPDYAPRELLRYKELWQHDIQLQYELPSGFAFYGGVNNFADQKPDQDATDVPISSLGRYFYVGAKIRLGEKR